MKANRNLARRAWRARTGALILATLLAMAACVRNSSSPRVHGRLLPATTFSHQLSGTFRLLPVPGSIIIDDSGYVAIRDRWQVSGVDVDSLKETWRQKGWFSVRDSASGTSTVLVLEGNLLRPMGIPFMSGFDGMTLVTVVIPRRDRGFAGAFAGVHDGAHGSPNGFLSFDGTISVDEHSRGAPRIIRMEGFFRSDPGSDTRWYTHLGVSLQSEIPSVDIPLESYHALFSDDPQVIEAEVARRGGIRGLPQRLFSDVLHSLEKVEGERARRLLIEACRSYRDADPITALGHLHIRYKKFREREVLEEIRSAFGLYHEEVDGYVLYILEKCGIPCSEELWRLLSSSDVRVLRSALRHILARRLELASKRLELADAVRGLADHPDLIVARLSHAILKRLTR